MQNCWPDRANWRYVKVRDLTRTTIRSMFKAITDRGAPVMANRTLALVSTMLNYALVELEWIEANPAARIRKNKETPRPRVLSDQEIRGCGPLQTKRRGRTNTDSTWLG
jgi:hypothetical protein